MAPSAERHNNQVMVTPLPPSRATLIPKQSTIAWRTVANAVNYEPSMVDWYQHSSSRVSAVGSGMDFTPERTTHHERERSLSLEENKAPNFLLENEQQIQEKQQPRKSKRESKQRTVSLNPKSVRYDMVLVPRVQKNRNFYNSLTQKIPEAPFFSSIIWRPHKRKEWEDCLSELVAVCTSAGLYKYNSLPKTKKKTIFVPPLSREYVRDRIDIDDPMRGFQIRHATQGWLQGFLLWTNFTTWTHYFTWDSKHKLCGLKDTDYPKDADGSLAQELQALPRQGHPGDSGVIFKNVAEIALLGGLGCGELLLKMALEEIRESQQYEYVVLQATVGSRSFYERFGFVRVGAVCRYGGPNSPPTLDTPEQGYRHWTHANESQKSLDMHGGPSYMMVLKLQARTTRSSLQSKKKSNLLEVLKQYTVTTRPKIEATPMTPTPKSTTKKLKRSISGSPIPPCLSPTTKRVYLGTPKEPAAKRPRRRSLSNVEHSSSSQTQNYCTPPPDGTPLSYAQKQYQSVWLAVPPISHTSKSRPKSGTSLTTSDKKGLNASRKSRNSISANTQKLKALKKLTTPQRQVVPSDKIQKVDRSVLCKQKVKSYPRDRMHYYNKVVTKNKKQYYFVLNYNEKSQKLVLCPMAVKGVLSGRRQGRPRFQCVLEATSANWITVPCKQYTPVEAFMVMKTPLVAQEAWDILGA